MNVNIAGLDKIAVLIALYDAAKPLGMGYMQYDPTPMTPEVAQMVIDEQSAQHDPMYFDHVKGRVMKVDLSGDEFSPRLYDRDNGDGAAAQVIAQLKTRG